jgi:hypothetical protein
MNVDTGAPAYFNEILDQIMAHIAEDHIQSVMLLYFS